MGSVAADLDLLAPDEKRMTRGAPRPGRPAPRGAAVARIPLDTAMRTRLPLSPSLFPRLGTHLKL